MEDEGAEIRAIGDIAAGLPGQVEGIRDYWKMRGKKKAKKLYAERQGQKKPASKTKLSVLPDVGLSPAARTPSFLGGAIQAAPRTLSRPAVPAPVMPAQIPLQRRPLLATPSFNPGAMYA